MIETKNLTKIYGSGEGKVVALNDVSIEFRKGEFCAIIGASGSGKSTLLHILGGLDVPTGGSVTFGGENISTMSDEALSAFRRKKNGYSDYA